MAVVVEGLVVLAGTVAQVEPIVAEVVVVVAGESAAEPVVEPAVLDISCLHGGSNIMTTPVTFSDSEVQSLNGQSVRLSSNGTWLGSKTAWIIDSCAKLYRIFSSPSKGYGISALCAESSMDFNAQGGEVVGGYFVAEGHGQIANQVNDIVGVSGTAHKATNAWAAGGHFDVYDTAPGGTAIGVNIEFPETNPATNTIGVNIQPNAGPDTKITGINLQGQYKAALEMSGAKVDKLLAVNSGSPMWIGNGSPGGALGSYAGSIQITIDGGVFHLPVYR